jgi:capsular polysaccharide transport system permease protein
VASVTNAEAEDQAQDQVEVQSSQDQGSSEPEAAPKTSNARPRRRTAALEVRAGRRRGGAATATAAADVEPEEGTGVAKKGTTRTSRGLSSRTTRSGGTTGSRNGSRAQQRAARAAIGEAAEAPAPVEGISLAEDVGVPQVDPVDNAVQVSEVRPVQAEVPPAPAAAEMPVTPPPATPTEVAPATVPAEDSGGDDAEDDVAPAPGTRRRAPAKPDKRSSRAAKPEATKPETTKPEATKNDASHYVVAPTVSPAQMRPRHYGVIVSFFLLVVVPTLSYSWYLWTRAADQYQSDVGFGSRTEEAGSTFDFLGALGGTTQSGSKDMDILNQFIVSQELVAKVDAEVDLRAMYTKAENDPLNAFHPDGTIEDLVKYWERMVLVNYDNATGLMNLEVFAFDPVDAKKIAEVVLVESTNIINELSKTAQEDITRYSKESLAATEAKLAEARLAVLDFQIRNSIVDPSNVIANQLSVVSTLNQQLAGAQIELDMIAGTVPEKDPRIALLNRRIEVIRNRISEEQSKVGAAADSTSPGFANLMADFERLKVDQDFAQQAYLSALAAHDQALTDAQHKTRYLSTYVAPTLAESSTAPNRPLTAFLVALIASILWAVIVLVYYALRDRR